MTEKLEEEESWKCEGEQTDFVCKEEGSQMVRKN